MTRTNGELPRADEGFSLISKSKLLALYTAMLACRRIVGQTGGRRRKSNSVIGQEAAAVGAAIDLLPQDAVVATVWPDAAIKAVNPSVSIVANTLFATRSALANKAERRISLLFSNGKSSSKTSWNKTLHLAAEHKLPFLFVSFGDHDGSEGAARAELPWAVKTAPLLPSIPVDGNDVVAVYRVASEAIAHARKGNGPTWIDCRAFIPGDPLESMQTYLRGKGLEPPAL